MLAKAKIRPEEKGMYEIDHLPGCCKNRLNSKEGKNELL